MGRGRQPSSRYTVVDPRVPAPRGQIHQLGLDATAAVDPVEVAAQARLRDAFQFGGGLVPGPEVQMQPLDRLRDDPQPRSALARRHPRRDRPVVPAPDGLAVDGGVELLGGPAEGAPFERSVEARKAQRFARTHAVTLGFLAEAQAQSGEFEAACETWSQALDTMDGVRSGRTRKVAATMIETFDTPPRGDQRGGRDTALSR